MACGRASRPGGWRSRSPSGRHRLHSRGRVTSFVCFAVAVALRLNLPAIQAANWVAMPMQVALILPFVRLGRRLIGFGSSQPFDAGALLHSSPSVIISRMGSLTGQAMLAWLVIAIPAVALTTLILTKVLRHIPAVAAAELGG